MDGDMSITASQISSSDNRYLLESSMSEEPSSLRESTIETQERVVVQMPSGKEEKTEQEQQETETEQGIDFDQVINQVRESVAKIASFMKEHFFGMRRVAADVK